MQIVKDFLIKFTKKSHLRHLLTKQTLDFVLHGLFGCFAEMDTHHICNTYTLKKVLPPLKCHTTRAQIAPISRAATVFLLITFL